MSEKTYQQKLADAGLIETADDAQARYFQESKTMNDHQLVLVAHEPDEPQPVWTNTAIKQMLNELAETRRQRNENVEVAEAWFRTSQQLQEQVADLTAKLASKEIECGNAQEQAADLGVKLDEANAELLELRIKCGLLSR